MTEFLPTRFAALLVAAPIAVWAGTAQLAFAKNLWLPLIGPVAVLAPAAATVLLFRYWIVDRDGRRIRAASSVSRTGDGGGAGGLSGALAAGR